MIACSVSPNSSPGISRLVTRALTPSFSAFAIVSTMISSEAGVMAPEILSRSPLFSNPAKLKIQML